MATFLPALLSGITGIAGGLLNKPQTTKTDQTTNTSNSSTSSATANQLPVYDPMQLQMRNYLISQFYNQTNPAAIHGLVSGMTNNAVNDINSSAGTQEQALQASLAGRGLSYSGAAGNAIGQQQQARMGQIFQQRAQAPLLEHSLQQQGLTSFADYLSRLPVGSQSVSTGSENSTGTQHMTGTNVGSGNPIGGAVSGAGSSLALMYGLGAFNKKPGSN